MSTKNVFVFCGDDCKSEGMTKEQILTAIEQAISTGEIKDVDTGFVTTIKEKNHLVGLSFWVGTQAEYNALPEKANNCFYIITDDTSFADVAAVVEQLQKQIDEQLQEELKELQTKIASLTESVLNANKGIEDINEALSMTPTTDTIFSGELCIGETARTDSDMYTPYKVIKVVFKKESDGTMYEGYANVVRSYMGNISLIFGDVPLSFVWNEDHLIFDIVPTMKYENPDDPMSSSTYYDLEFSAYIKSTYIEQQNEGDLTNIQANINEVGAYNYVLTEIVGII